MLPSPRHLKLRDQHRAAPPYTYLSASYSLDVSGTKRLRLSLTNTPSIYYTLASAFRWTSNIRHTIFNDRRKKRNSDRGFYLCDFHVLWSSVKLVREKHEDRLFLRDDCFYFQPLSEERNALEEIFEQGARDTRLPRHDWHAPLPPLRNSAFFPPASPKTLAIVLLSFVPSFPRDLEEAVMSPSTLEYFRFSAESLWKFIYTYIYSKLCLHPGVISKEIFIRFSRSWNREEQSTQGEDVVQSMWYRGTNGR